MTLFLIDRRLKYVDDWISSAHNDFFIALTTGDLSHIPIQGIVKVVKAADHQGQQTEVWRVWLLTWRSLEQSASMDRRECLRQQGRSPFLPQGDT